MSGPRLSDLLAEAAARLARAGVPGAAGDARRLVAHAAGLETGALAAALSEPAPPALAGRLAPLLAAREARQPVSQIVGLRAFWAHDFEVTPDVLDPRPETELLVEVALREPFATLLDIGTGSGCILLSLLAARPEAQGTGTDISQAALAVAARNAARLGIGARLRLIRADWAEGVAGRFDLIVSNPPYLAEAEFPGLEPEPRLWEPKGALVSGPSGLEAYRAIAAAAPGLLAPGGRLVLEHGPGQGPAIAALLRGGGLDVAAPLHDLDGRARAILARKPGRA